MAKASTRRKIIRKAWNNLKKRMLITKNRTRMPKGYIQEIQENLMKDRLR